MEDGTALPSLFGIMKININGYDWNIIYTHNRKDLSRSDGSITLGVTDRSVLCIYLYDKLQGYMLRKVLVHELVHAWIFSYDIYLSVEQEEFVCRFIDTYGDDIFSKADELLCMGLCRTAL